MSSWNPFSYFWAAPAVVAEIKEAVNQAVQTPAAPSQSPPEPSPPAAPATKSQPCEEPDKLIAELRRRQSLRQSVHDTRKKTVAELHQLFLARQMVQAVLETREDTADSK